MKPCVKCGAEDRKKRGDCRPCNRVYNAKRNAKRYTENPEKEKARLAKYRTENPEQWKAVKAKWRKLNPELHRIYEHNRRARKRATGGKLSNNLGEVLYARQKGKCACCNEPLGDNYNLDHIMPIKLGGANENWNIQLLRPSCNSSKGAKHPLDYMREQGFLL